MASDLSKKNLAQRRGGAEKDVIGLVVSRTDAIHLEKKLIFGLPPRLRASAREIQ